MQYDVVVVGSGPISLLEALFLRKQGHKVLVVEQDSVIGGAWRTIAEQNLPPLEIGCHIWDIDRKTYEFLAEYLALELEWMQPTPQIFAGNMRVPYARKNLIIAGKNAMGSLKRGKIGDFFKFSGEALGKGATLLPKKYLYPRGGSSELMAGLEQKIAESGLEIKTELELRHIDASEEFLSLATSQGKISAKELVITTFSQLQSYVSTAGDKIQIPQGKPRDFIHFHLVFEDGSKPNFTYIRMMQDAVIHRVSDVTSQLSFGKVELAGKRVLIAGVHESAYGKMSETDIIEHICAKLKKEKLIDANAELSTSFSNVYHTEYFGNEQLESFLLGCGGKVRSVHSTNFIHDIRDLLIRWKKI